MKSTRFTLGKALWRTLTVLCAVLFVSFGFIACKPETETETEYVTVTETSYVIIKPYTDSADYEKLNSATWNSVGGDSYTFDDATVTYNDGGWGYDWEGTVAGLYGNYIYFKYTSVGTGLDASIVGQYNAINYKELTDSSVNMGTASNYTNNGKASTATLEEAIEEFTIAKGYWTYWGEYTK